jgi:hypothetical protein
MEVERLHAENVSDNRQSPQRFVPHDDGKRPVESLEALYGLLPLRLGRMPQAFAHVRRT